MQGMAIIVLVFGIFWGIWLSRRIDKMKKDHREECQFLNNQIQKIEAENSKLKLQVVT